MKNKTVKIIAFLSLIVLIMSIFNPISFAEDTEFPSEQAKQEDEIMEKLENIGTFALDTLAYIPLLIIKIPVFLLAEIMRILSGIVAGLGGGSLDVLNLSVDKILFNEVPLVKLDFFNIAGETNNTLRELRQNIAQWYYILRNISLVILLGVLIYVGIRMAISTVAEEEAKYKKCLKIG